MAFQPNVLNGVNLDKPADIHNALCKYSKAGNVKALTGLLENKLVRKEIDYDSGWTALGSAIINGQSEAALVLLRNGASPLCSIGGGPEVKSYVSKKKNMYRNNFNEKEFEALHIAIVANRIFRSDTKSVCELLSDKCPSSSTFSVKKLQTELELHRQDSEQDISLTKALTHVLTSVVADESISDVNKEEFAAFCKLNSGISILESDKPEQVDLKVPLQMISSHLLISSWKPRCLDILGLEDSRDLQIIYKVEEKFAENFLFVFEKLFIEDPEETEMFILENYEALYSQFLQIYHYHFPAKSRDQLEAILINVTEKVAKEPVAVGLVMSLTHRMQGMQREINDLTTTVEDLKSKLAAQDEKIVQIISALKLK